MQFKGLFIVFSSMCPWVSAFSDIKIILRPCPQGFAQIPPQTRGTPPTLNLRMSPKLIGGRSLDLVLSLGFDIVRIY